MKLSRIFALLLVGTHAATVNGAELHRTMSGHECVTTSSSLSSAIYSPSGVFNGSSSTVTFICPIRSTSLFMDDVADSGAFDDPFQDFNVNFRLGTTSSLSCRAVACPSNGLGCLQGPFAQAISFDPPVQDNILVGNTSFVGDEADGYSFLQCTVPGSTSSTSSRSGIISYNSELRHL